MHAFAPHVMVFTPQGIVNIKMYGVVMVAMTFFEMQLGLNVIAWESRLQIFLSC
jgi:hypothetical protein